jgi:hypothetical protein
VVRQPYPIKDLVASNVNDLLIYTAGMEAAGPGGNFSGSVSDINSNQTVGDAPRTNPQGSSRTRGLDAPNFTRGFFASDIPMDAYNTESVTVNRGPNAALFGAGIADDPVIPITVQSWGETATVHLPPEGRWFVTNTFSF